MLFMFKVKTRSLHSSLSTAVITYNIKAYHTKALRVLYLIIETWVRLPVHIITEKQAEKIVNSFKWDLMQVLQKVDAELLNVITTPRTARKLENLILRKSKLLLWKSFVFFFFFLQIIGQKEA